MPLNVETIIPENDSVRTLVRIAERINYTKLSGAYEWENPRVVWRKEVEKGMAKLAEKQKKRTAELRTRYAFELGKSKEPEEMLFQLLQRFE